MTAVRPRASADLTGRAASDRGLRLLLDSAVPFRIPLARPFRRVDAREGLLLRGPSGWGEFAPFLEYDARAAARWLAAAVEAAWGDWPPGGRAEIPVNAVVPAVDADTAYEMAASACRVDGCATVKVKVAEPGHAAQDDLARVSAVRRALDDCGMAAPAGRIRVDANGAWDVETAAAVLPALDAAAGGLEYVEQPCPDIAQLAELRPRTGVRIAADESIRTARDPRAAVVAGRVDVAVLKVPHLGGVSAALRTAQACRIPVVVSGAMDSAVGLGAGIALAAALPELPLACGLGTGALLAADVTEQPVRPAGGVLRTGRIAPDPEALADAEARMPGPRRDWWRRRLARAWLTGANQYASRWLPTTG